MPATETALVVCSWMMAALGVFSWSLILYSLHRARTVRAQAGDLLLPAVRVGLPQTQKKAIAIFCVAMFFVAISRERWVIVLFGLSCFFTMSVFVFWGWSSLGPSYLEVRQRGLIVGGVNLLEWPQLKSLRFQGTESIRLVTQTIDARLDFPIQHDYRQALDKALTQHMPQQAEKLVCDSAVGSV